MPKIDEINWQDFEKVHLRTGKIIDVQDFPEAKKPAYKLIIDFGPEIGTKKSSARIVENYSKEDLMGKIVICVTNFPPKQIGPFVSEVLVCGTEDKNGNITLLNLDHDVDINKSIY